ncbi:MAG TPA: DUF4126 domain-containing protein [Micropruina sp.]|nr:DUF4126 domain-containing protein [Micropruina sp.]
MEILPLAFTSGWASGINTWATVLLLGLMGRYAGVAGIPPGFERTDVLIVMGVLAIVEVVADKIPYLDSAWDVVSTFIRPIGGATIGALMAGQTGDLGSISLAAVGGVTALLSHLAKASVRLAVNTSPEPLSNLTASAVGDLSLIGVLSLAALYPVAAATVAAVLLVMTIGVALFLLNRVVRGWHRLQAWRAARRATA